MNMPGFTAEACLGNGITKGRFALPINAAATAGKVLPQEAIGEPRAAVGFANPPGCYHAGGCPNGSPCCTIYRAGGKCYCDRCCVG